MSVCLAYYVLYVQFMLTIEMGVRRRGRVRMIVRRSGESGESESGDESESECEN